MKSLAPPRPECRRRGKQHLFAAPAEDEGIASLEPNDEPPRLGMMDEERVDGGLRDTVFAFRLAGEDQEGGGRRLVEERRARELVIDHHLRLLSQRRPRTVISSGSPGPAPTRITRPLPTEALQEPRPGVRHAPRRDEATQSASTASRQPPAPTDRRRARVSAAGVSDLDQGAAVIGQELVDLLAHEPGRDGARASGGYGDRDRRTAQHGGPDEVAKRVMTASGRASPGGCTSLGRKVGAARSWS